MRGNRWLIQPSVSFQVGPRTDLFVQGQINRRSQLEYSGIPAAQAFAGQINRNAFPGAPEGQPNTVINNKLATAILRHGFSDMVRLTVSGRYYHSDSRDYGSFVFDYAFPADPAAPTTYSIFLIYLKGRAREATVDTNFQASVDALGGQYELLAGVNYDRTRFFADLGFDFVTIGNLDLANPDYGLAYCTPPQFLPRRRSAARRPTATRRSLLTCRTRRPMGRST